MKIAMVFPHPDSEKGISAYSINLIKNLRKQGVGIEEITFMQGKPLTLFKKLQKILKYDIIHIQHEYNLLGWFGIPYFFLFCFLGFFKKESLIVTMHTVLSQKEKFKESRAKTFLRKIIYKLQNKWIDWTIGKIVVHAQIFKKILVEEYNIQEDKVIVLPHAIIEDIKTVNKEKARKELDLKGKVYLMMGNLSYDNGTDIILNQANKIGKTILVATNPKPVNLRDSEKTSNYILLNKEILRRNKFEKFVRFDLKEIPYKLWWKYFSAADLVLLPYRGGIGSGIFADAMVVRKPAVASNIPYFFGIAKKYGCIKLANTNNDFPRAIKEAMKPKKYKKMVKECERYVKENSLTSVSKKYKKLYESLS